MIFLVLSAWTFLRAVFGDAVTVTLENVALRYQLVVLQRSVARPRVCRRDRIFLVWLARLWTGWRASVVIVQPATVLAWHRQGFQLYLRWKSRTRVVGRPPIDRDIRDLIRRMACENPTWGRLRIQAELHFLGYDVAELTIAKYMRRRPPRPSPTWRTFLGAHLHEIAAVDFFVVPTPTFRLLFAFVILRHDRREFVHVNVTSHLTASWATRQVIDAFPYELAPKYLLRDRDAIYGDEFTLRIADMGVHEFPHRPARPLAESFAERLIRLHPPGMPRPLPRTQRTASPAPLACIPRGLQSGPSSSSARQQ
jgi:putative transposase